MEIHSCSYFCSRPDCIKSQRAELREEVAMLRKTWADARTDLTTEAIENIGLRKRIAELEADAGRYRWLRERDWFSGPLCVVRDPQTVLAHGWALGRDCPSRDRLDAAIDAARG